MARITVEDCLENVTDQFALVHLAAQRYRQLHRGANRLIDNKNKDVVCALREIAGKKVRFREEIDAALLSDGAQVISQRLQQLEQSSPVVKTAEQAVEDTNAPTPLI
tara:strand:+ start:508 stop:828 length:321 start_codon:yes stop_codon:yes gene_type:complete